MNKRTTITTLVLVAIIGVVATLWFKRGSTSNLKQFEALGEVAAQETAKLIGGSGEIVLIVPDFGESKNQTQDAQMSSFLNELKRQKGVTIAGVEKVNLAPPQSSTKPGKLRFFEPTTGGPPLSQPGQLSQLVNTYAQAKAIVAFMDLPPLGDADIPTLKDRGTKLVVVSDYKDGYKALLQAEVLHLAIVPRWEPLPETGKKPRTMKDWFDRSYTVITPEKAEEMP